MSCVYRGLVFGLPLLFLIGRFSAFSHMQLLYVHKNLCFCVEQPPSFCVQGIINGKFCSFLKIPIQTESKIWFYLANWDDDIFLSHSFISKWCSNILLWQKKENKLSENLPLTSWQIPTENQVGKLAVASLSYKRTGGCGRAEWPRVCVVCSGNIQHDCEYGGGGGVFINVGVG